MPNMEEIFQTSQFLVIQCIRNLTEISSNLEDTNPFSARSNIDLLNHNINTLERLIDAMEDEEHENILKEDEDEDEQDDELPEST